jgi:membrane fusion protein (multidrug efflux system)
MTFADGSVYPHEGKLDFADVGLRSETGTLQGRFVFPNPEGDLSPGQSYFYPGQFVKIRLKGYIRTDAILVPQRAVQQGPKGTFLNVVGPEDTIEVREVHATNWKGRDWLIEDGLQPGERVVVEGFHRIQPGMRVHPVLFRNEESSSVSQSQESLTKPAGRQETP